MPELTRALDYYFDLLVDLGSRDVLLRRDGSTLREVRSAEDRLGFSFPAEVVEWFLWADGVGWDEDGVEHSSPSFLPCEAGFRSLDSAVREQGNLEIEDVISWAADPDSADPFGLAGAPRLLLPILESHGGFFEVECGDVGTGGIFYWNDSDAGWTARSLLELVERAIGFVEQGWTKIDEGYLTMKSVDELRYLIDLEPEVSQDTLIGPYLWLQDPREFQSGSADGSLLWRWTD